MKKRAIVWFKTDLRIHDNETLAKAIEKNDEIIPVYCFDDAHYDVTEYGFNKTGNIRARFIIESVQNLENKLKKLGSGLIVVKGKPERELPKLVKLYDVQKVYAKKEVAYEEKQTEERVEKELWHLQCTLETFSTSTLYHAEDLPMTIRDIPDTFTLFRKEIENITEIRPICKSPFKINSPYIQSAYIPDLKRLGLNEFLKDKRASYQFKGGEDEILIRLNYYFHDSKAIEHYKDTRNGMIGSDYSTKFSAYLALGCVSPRYIYEEIKKYEKTTKASDSTYWLYFELLWRDYFRFMMKKHRHKFFLQTGIKEQEVDLAPYNENLLNKWVNGITGVDFIDANMLELKYTGFMSNRGRQNVASYLCNDLKIDWRYGAAYFEQQLIDYDVCSNWGNWAYLAGVGNDPRGKRYFNIEKQAKEYDSEFNYRNLWIQR